MFRFKQFSVEDCDCGMKVGVDGVLLGAWIAHKNPVRILDVGTGSGLIALMLAQKYPKAKIDAVEIEESAARQAQKNFENNSFRNDFKVHENDFLDLEPDNFHPAQDKFDIIVSNLPYFKEGPKITDQKRDLARSARYLPLKQFLLKSKNMLATNGAIYLVYPSEIIQSLNSLNDEFNLHVDSVLSVRGNSNSDVKRCLLKITHNQLQQPPASYEEIVIEKSRNVYTEQYKKLCQEFYLKF